MNFALKLSGILFSWMIIFPLRAQDNLSVQEKEIYDEFLKLKVKTGEQKLNELSRKVPATAFVIGLENYADVIYLLTSDDPVLFKKLNENEEIRIKRIKNTDINSPYFLFSQAEIRLQWAFLKLRFGHETQAAFGFQKAFKLISENQKKFPDFLPNQKISGVLHVLIGSVPDKYQWISDFLGLTGTVSGGMQELDNVRNSNVFCNQEAELIYQLFHAYLLKFKPETIEKLSTLYSKNADNLLFCFAYAIAAIKHNHGGEVIQILHNCPRGTEYPPFYLLEYLKGEVYLQQNKYDNAWYFYNKFLKSAQGNNFIKDSYYKLFLCQWLKNNNQNTALYLLDKVLKTGESKTEADKYANRYAEKKQFCDPVLMKARLAFDGGYYTQALAFLENCTEKSFSNPRDKAEFAYRYGRLYDKLNNTSKALNYYLRAIQLSEKDGYYFGANAALQCGYIYVLKNDKKNARYYFEKALSFNSDEYKNSIRSKAKAALREL
jgi:tetratricopeptide (TPR) repeat protein